MTTAVSARASAPRVPETSEEVWETHRPNTEGEGRARVILENVVPQVDGGRFPAKRSVGEVVRVEVDAFTDGHDKLSVSLRHRGGEALGQAEAWQEVEMSPLVNDRWMGEFAVHAVGWHEFTISAW